MRIRKFGWRPCGPWPNCNAAGRRSGDAALDLPQDRFIDHALWLTVRDLQPYWLPALEAGQLTFDGNTGHLTYVLRAGRSPGVVRRW